MTQEKQIIENEIIKLEDKKAVDSVPTSTPDTINDYQ